jgi:peptidoglycan/LPS O-acetylase OafA/YrhL
LGGNLLHLGVLLFLVHTALVLMMSIERLGLSGRSLYASFAVRRICRIYPLAISCVIVVVLFRIPPTTWSAYEWAGWPAILSNVFLTQNLTQSLSVNGVLWSLPFEIQMYAILPLLFGWALRFPRLRAMYALWLVAVPIAASEYVVRSASSTSFLVARYSYGVYICHMPILWLCFVKFQVGPALVGLVLAILLTPLISILVYHWLEDPFIRVGKQLAARVAQSNATQGIQVAFVSS